MSSQFNKVGNTDVSNYSRLLGPLPLILNFDLFELLFGIGLGNKVNYIEYFNIPVAGGDGDTFSNTIFSLIISFGVVGFLIFIALIVKIYKNCCRGWSSSYFLLMVILFFSTNFVIETILFYYLLFVVNTPLLIRKRTLFSSKTGH
jgi:hypothetical protein